MGTTAETVKELFRGADSKRGAFFGMERAAGVKLMPSFF